MRKIANEMVDPQLFDDLLQVLVESEGSWSTTFSHADNLESAIVAILDPLLNSGETNPEIIESLRTARSSALKIWEGIDDLVSVFDYLMEIAQFNGSV